MRMLSAATFVLCATALVGCAGQPTQQPPSEENYNSLRKKFITDSAYRKEQTEKCRAMIRTNDRLATNFGIILNIPKDKTPELVCSRVEKAIIDGRFDYSMHASMVSGQPTPKFIRIIQGR